MCYNLSYEDIGYTALGQLEFNYNHPTKIEPEDITLIRCDGVVEYCYEYYGYRIYGSDSTWNISIPGNQIYHMGLGITPKKQAQNYMTPVY